MKARRLSTNQIDFQSIFRKHVALPSDHGSWVFLFSPMLIGLFAGRNWTISSFYLIVAALAAFLMRQPATIAVKVYSNRRPQRDLPAAIFWIAVYALIAGLAFLGLILHGFVHLFILVIPGILVFLWHLWLVSRRSERRQIGVEIVGSGVLALAAPAAYWVNIGNNDSLGWWLFGLTWFQSAASIVYAYLRLEQRERKTMPDMATRIMLARRAVSYTTFNLLVVSGLSLAGILSPLLPLAYAVQWAETLWGTLNPAVGVKPTRIGIRQLFVSTLFTLVFILTW